VLHGPQVAPFAPPKDLETRPPLVIAVSSERLFALADYDILSDPFFRSGEAEPVMEQILMWLTPPPVGS
jgi:hypothetical protein